MHGGVNRGDRACEGANDGGHRLKSVEIYDTSAGQWRASHIRGWAGGVGHGPTCQASDPT